MFIIKILYVLTLKLSENDVQRSVENNLCFINENLNKMIQTKYTSGSKN